MHAPTLFESLSSLWPIPVALLAVIALVKTIASLFKRDRLGEMHVLSTLRGLDTAIYQHFHDLDLPHPTERGGIRVDHVVVSPFGIFVIETTDRKGWIFGSEHEPEWIQRIHWRRKHFQNPLQMNRLKVDALMKFLNLPDPPFRPMVVFTRDCRFKAPLPGMVLADSLIPWIRGHRVTMLDPSMVLRAVTRLRDHQDALTRKAAEQPQLHALHVRQAV